jgi:Conserved region in glutamate synthase
MPQSKKNISLRAAIVLTAALINVLIIKFASINKPEIYWLLMLSIPLLFFAFYFITKKHKLVHDTLTCDDNSSSFSELNKDKGLTVLFGNSYCSQPYLSSIFCNEAVYSNESFDATSKKDGLPGENNFVQASENIHHDNESKHDLIWQITPGYPGCRNEKFNFNSALFRINAAQPFVKMIELRLVPPAKENNLFKEKDIYSDIVINNKYPVTSLQSVTKHTAFIDAEGMVVFLDTLRQLSAKKPIGVRICVTDKKEFHEICYAFRKTGILPDYIAIEDYDKENNSSLNYSQSFGMPLYEALLFVSKTLEMYGLEKEIKIIAVTPVNSAFDVLKLYALGADGLRMQNFVTINGKRKTLSRQFIKNLRYKILVSTMEIMKSCNYRNVNDITLPSLLRKLDSLQFEALPKIYNEEVETDSETRKLQNGFSHSTIYKEKHK